MNKYIENAEAHNMPTPEMKKAFEDFTRKMQDQTVGSRDTFYHGYRAALLECSKYLSRLETAYSNEKGEENGER